ncbi:ABC transporter, periplasmic binding protein [[Clostridium] ultunense Esp]|nr:ABC transporter, periplasmic binding protein [[Clostridium] ultunense Esp]
MKTLRGLLLLTFVFAFIVSGCGGQTSGNNTTRDVSKNNTLTLQEIEAKAKEEGQIVSVGMPDTWANWKETWEEITQKYGLKHTDTDMSSAEELAKFEAEKNNPTADIGDVGISFGPLAVEKGLVQPYKTSYWDEIPSWAKDSEGYWMVGYTGSIAIITDKDQVQNPPKTWDDILKGNYKVAVGDVTKATQAQMAVLAAALAHGGDEKNIEPGLQFFAELAKQGRLLSTEVSVANFEKGEIPVGFLWDFNALGYRDQIDPKRFEVNIPEEGTVMSGYASVINKYAPHPHAAMLTREYIFSDEGQINLAKGYARPIRDKVKLPEEVAKKLIPSEQYKNAKPVLDYKAWEETAKKLPQLWQEKVLIYVK